MLCADGQLRLRGGTTSTEGRVEICIAETWGTICDDSWNTQDAQVACRSLGFSYLGKKREDKKTISEVVFIRIQENADFFAFHCVHACTLRGSCFAIFCMDFV